MSVKSNICKTLIYNTNSSLFICKENNKIKNINVWNIFNKPIYEKCNNIILIEMEDHTFISSKKNKIYYSKHPTIHSLWITCYNINTDKSDNIDLIDFYTDKYITNIYGYILHYNNNFYLETIVNNAELVLTYSCIFLNYIQYNINYTITFPFINTYNVLNTFYIKEDNKILHSTYTLWTLSKYYINTNIICVLQESNTKQFLNYKDKIYYTDNITDNSILLLTYDIFLDFKYRTISNTEGLYLSLNLNTNSLNFEIPWLYTYTSIIIVY
jgi:hypothetical protein